MTTPTERLEEDPDDGISLRPRTMFAMKGRGRADSEGSSPYRPQWSKDGEGFVSSSTDDSGTRMGKEPDNNRRKSKVLRYSRDELLALHYPTKSPPKFPEDTMVASEHCLPPVGTLPFDFDEVYKQWALNRNRGRGRGRGANNSNPPPTGRNDSKWEEEKPVWERSLQSETNDKSLEENALWERGAKFTNDNAAGDDIWDDVRQDGSEMNEMDLSSMAEAAERFRREMDALRLQEKAQIVEDTSPQTVVHLEDSNKEDLWDMPEPTISKESSQSTALQSTFESVPVIERLDEWFYLDPQGRQQGPFKTAEMREWFEAGYFKPHLPIRYGNEGVFSPLASHFAQGQIPFSGPPRHLEVDLQKQREEEQRHRMLMLQQQQMLHLQQQQQRMLQINQEENLRREMQRIEMRRQQEHQLFQQQQMIQQQHLLMEQQSAWQRSQREGIMTALGIFDSTSLGAAEQRPSPSTVIAETEKQARNDSEIQSHHNSTWQASEKSQLNVSLPGSAWNEVAQIDASVPTGTDSKQSVDIIKQPTISQKSKSVTSDTDKSVEGKILQPEAPKLSNNSTVWNEKPNAHKESKKSTRKIEEKEKNERQVEPKANLVQMGAQLKMMLGVDETMKSTSGSSGAWSTPATSHQSVNAWNTGGATAGPATTKSLRDILAEEERLAQERAKKSEVLGPQASSHWVNVVAGINTVNSSTKSSRSLGPVPASVLKSTRNLKTSAAANVSESHLGEKKSDVSENDSSFWNFGAAGQSKSANEVSHVSAFGVDISSTDFMSWCSLQLKSLGGIEDLTLVEYCASLEDPGEIREYLAAYLGSTPRVSAFATEFIQRKKSLKMSKKLSNTNLSEVSGDFSQKKGKRRSKGQKIDPTLLNYSVGSN